MKNTGLIVTITVLVVVLVAMGIYAYMESSKPKNNTQLEGLPSGNSTNTTSSNQTSSSSSSNNSGSGSGSGSSTGSNSGSSGGGWPYNPPSTNSCYNASIDGNKILKKGDVGCDVLKLQELMLNHQAQGNFLFLSNTPQTGTFDYLTESNLNTMIGRKTSSVNDFSIYMQTGNYPSSTFAGLFNWW